MNAKQEAPERQEIEELLPWHAAGTLSRRDAQRVEEALARDPELARRYALVREELGETISLNETLGAPSARALENLFAKIDAELHASRRRLSISAAVSANSLPACHHARSRQPPLHWRSWCRPDFSRTSC
jgi:anti-sigma factor RsiW